MSGKWIWRQTMMGLGILMCLGVGSTGALAEGAAGVDCGAEGYSNTADRDDGIPGDFSVDSSRDECQRWCYNDASYCRAQCSTSYGNGNSMNCLRSCDIGLCACLAGCQKI